MKSQLIKTDLPLNFEKESMEKYFTPLINSKIKVPKIKYLKNVFVNSQGLVLKNGFLVKGCAFNLIGNKDNTFYYPFWKLVLEQMVVSKWGKSLKSIQLKNDCYLLIHSKWFNYSFWINSYLLRLIQAEELGLLDKVKLIYPKEWDAIPYVVESLKCFNIAKEVIPLDTNLFVQNLILPETREWTNSFSPNEMTKIKNKVVPFAIKNTSLNQFSKRIYLTRKNSRARSVENENELIPILEKYQFQILFFDDLSFWDQVAMLNNAECFVSIHGAGFSNMLFMKEGTAVMELVNQSYADVEYKFPFWKLANSCNLKYYVQFGKVLNKNVKLVRGSNPKANDNYLVDENIIIDKILFEKNILKMISKF
jgi:hypothetical protein